MATVLQSIQVDQPSGNPSPPATSPPAYSREASPFSDTSDDSNVAMLQPPQTPTTTLRINAPMTIKGSGNIISTHPSLETTRLLTVLSSALMRSRAQEQQSHHLQGHPTTVASRSARNVNIELFCGVTIIGDRNIVGGFPHPLLVRRQQAQQAAASAAASARARANEAAMKTNEQAKAGVKRKAEDGEGNVEEPMAKKVAV